MLLAYVDESYDKSKYWIAGLICPEEEVVPLTESLDDVVEDAAAKYCYDNNAVEALWATLKRELGWIHNSTTWPNRADVRSALFDYTEGFYNPNRIQRRLGHQSPAGYEQPLSRLKHRVHQRGSTPGPLGAPYQHVGVAAVGLSRSAQSPSGSGLCVTEHDQCRHASDAARAASTSSPARSRSRSAASRLGS